MTSNQASDDSNPDFAYLNMFGRARNADHLAMREAEEILTQALEIAQSILLPPVSTPAKAADTWPTGTPRSLLLRWQSPDVPSKLKRLADELERSQAWVARRAILIGLNRLESDAEDTRAC